MRRIINNIRHHRNWISYYAWKYTGKKGEGFRFHIRGGVTVNVPKRMMPTYKECFFDDTYFKGFPKEIAARKLDTVMDVGANVGYFSLSLFSRFPAAQVFAFEPMKVNFSLLETYRAAHPHLSWYPENKAISNNTDPISLFFDQSDSFTTAATISHDSGQADEIQVEATTLEEVFNQFGLDQIDFLKLDCEGSEYQILYAAPPDVLTRIRAMSIETHKQHQPMHNKQELAAFLRKNHFSVNLEKDHIWAWT